MTIWNFELGKDEVAGSNPASSSKKTATTMVAVFLFENAEKVDASIFSELTIGEE